MRCICCYFIWQHTVTSAQQTISLRWASRCTEAALRLKPEATNVSIMPKWGKHRKLYRKEWETDPELKTWIAPVPGNDSKARYKYFNRPLLCSLQHIVLRTLLWSTTHFGRRFGWFIVLLGYCKLQPTIYLPLICGYLMQIWSSGYLWVFSIACVMILWVYTGVWQRHSLGFFFFFNWARFKLWLCWKLSAWSGNTEYKWTLLNEHKWIAKTHVVYAQIFSAHVSWMRHSVYVIPQRSKQPLFHCRSFFFFTHLQVSPYHTKIYSTRVWQQIPLRLLFVLSFLIVY